MSYQQLIFAFNNRQISGIPLQLKICKKDPHGRFIRIKYNPCRLPSWLHDKEPKILRFALHYQANGSPKSVKRTQEGCHFDPEMVYVIQCLVRWLEHLGHPALATQLWQEFRKNPEMANMPVKAEDIMKEEVKQSDYKECILFVFHKNTVCLLIYESTYLYRRAQFGPEREPRSRWNGTPSECRRDGVWSTWKRYETDERRKKSCCWRQKDGKPRSDLIFNQ